MEEYGLSCPSLYPTQHSLSLLHRNPYVAGTGKELKGFQPRACFWEAHMSFGMGWVLCD